MHDRLHAPIGRHGHHIAPISSDMNYGTCGVHVRLQHSDSPCWLRDALQSPHGIVLVVEGLSIGHMLGFQELRVAHVGEGCCEVVRGVEAVQASPVIHDEVTSGIVGSDDGLGQRLVVTLDLDLVAGAVPNSHQTTVGGENIVREVVHVLIGQDVDGVLVLPEVVEHIDLLRLWGYHLIMPHLECGQLGHDGEHTQVTHVS